MPKRSSGLQHSIRAIHMHLGTGVRGLSRCTSPASEMKPSASMQTPRHS